MLKKLGLNSPLKMIEKLGKSYPKVMFAPKNDRKLPNAKNFSNTDKIEKVASKLSKMLGKQNQPRLYYKDKELDFK